MVTEEYRRYLQSETWQKLRSKRLAIDEFRCQRCGTPYGLQVHHLAYPDELGTEDPYIHLITLCGPCHEAIENQKQMYRKDKLDAIQEQRNYELRAIYRTIRQMSCYDLSAIGIGTKDYCNIDVIKADFGPLMKKGRRGHVRLRRPGAGILPEPALQDDPEDDGRRPDRDGDPPEDEVLMEHGTQSVQSPRQGDGNIKKRKGERVL